MSGPHTPEAAQPTPSESEPLLTRSRHRALQAARHALRVPPVPRDFRADIEGMRALAVLGVLLWHAGVRFLPGGFTGVDVFFVVSGFLMTSLLLEEARARGRIDLGRFYARRARRLLPAALAALVGTALLTVAFLPRSRWAETGADLVASATYLVNWRMAWRSVDYLDIERAPSPVQHYWSLAVEEQFYVVWPILLLLVWSSPPGAPGSHPAGLVAHPHPVPAVARGVLGVDPAGPVRLLRHADPDPRAHARVLVALGRGPGRGCHGRSRRWSVGGPRYVLAASSSSRPGRSSPGVWALLPTVGTALVWWPCVRRQLGTAARAADPGPAVGRPPVLQPLPVALAVHRGGRPPRGRGAGRAGHAPGAVGAAGRDRLGGAGWLSFRYVEDPVRRHGRVLAGSSPAQVVTWRTLRLGLNLTLVGTLVGVVLLTAAPSSVTRETAQWRTPEVVDELREPLGAGTLAAGQDENEGLDEGGVDGVDGRDGGGGGTVTDGATDGAATEGPGGGGPGRTTGGDHRPGRRCGDHDGGARRPRRAGAGGGRGLGRPG
ncbi:acyltransferase family protein [Ornithinimicrobium flavum]|uniref:acyltransferase family protein n=1 Tax=Ornithinimicrobium flavum TaxID=1288636 RepID=UPI00106FB058|nr:acyltransferase [Ornithinimicrobium flavum]